MNGGSVTGIAEQAEQLQVFVASWWRQLLYILLFDLPALGMGMIFLSLLVERSTCPQTLSNTIVGVVGMLFGFGMFFLWLVIAHEKIVLTPTSLVRTSILGRKTIPLSDIVSARCGIQGRGNTLLVVETAHGRRRMGMSLPTKVINQLADLLNSRVKRAGTGQPFGDSDAHVSGVASSQSDV